MSPSTAVARRRSAWPVLSMRATAREWRARNLARRQLASLSDRELHDIGTCRAEIACEIGKPVWQK